ncbi:tyrosine-type recombinase/integrase [Gilliamella sp. Pra-s65]|uniref:tyrosine-type recombinase/integrase n=1 Tax=unclassified Gilliamella TaxID=2685620 RepID=UPI0013658A9A|nr:MULTISPECIES: site-specific integrase [unclassified Gilliamella]MWN90988.1 tyrosine-type recombinase/integrase [Gilliamella sp. Pra-s65]MWP73904.1 tyrosine-type recombinase/integrase [Gilliamella sp. Pra-s52]
MSLSKRNGVYYIDIRTPSGERIRRSTGVSDKKLAQEYHDKVKHELWAVSRLDKRLERTFDEALLLLLNDGKGQKDYATKVRHAKYWRSIFGGKNLSSITGETIDNNLPTHNAKNKEPLAPATINKYRKTILRALSLAQKNNWISSVPYVGKQKEPKVRVRWITKQQAQDMLNNISIDWLRDVCLFALLTGARRTEILSLTWDKIDFQNKIAIVSNDIAKNGKARSLLLNDEAIELLRNRRLINSKYVFVSTNNNPLKDIDRRAFNRATEICNIEDFHFHDLRHTWASWHVQSGTPLFTLQELGGWETLEMVKKYAHLNAEHLSHFSNAVTIWSQNKNKDNQALNLAVVND